MKKIIEMFKNDKKKIFIGIGCFILLLVAIISFAVSRKNANSIKNEDVAMQALLDIFYKDSDEKKLGAILLGDTKDKYFGAIAKKNYDQVYEQLSTLGEGDLIEDMNAVEIANMYTDASIDVLRGVKSAKVTNKQEIDNGGHRFTIEVIPGDLNNAYKEGNDCAVDLLEKLPQSNPELAEMEGNQYAVYYYCIGKGLANVRKEYANNEGEKNLFEVVLTKNEKGQYVPDEQSLKNLLSAAY